MFCDPKPGTREIQNVLRRGTRSSELLGRDIINLDKLGAGWAWRAEQITNGFPISAGSSTISPPLAAIEGSRMFIMADVYAPGSMQVRAKEIHVLRGMGRLWLVSCFLWGSMIQI